MTAAFPASRSHEVAPPPEHPVVIDGLFGWLSIGAASRGVILCGTHGYEQHCAHRPWRDLAHSIAATGCTVLRFDYPGAGDSHDAGAGGIEGWVNAIRHAIRHMRERVGIDEVVLVGFRLGGTLVALAARDTPVERLVLLEPFVTVRAFLREMALQARVINVLPDGRPMPGEPERLAVGGFSLETDFFSTARDIDLAAADRAPAPDILVVGAERTKLASSYEALGARVATAPFPDLIHLCSHALTSAMSPETMTVVAAFAGKDARPRDRLPEPPGPNPRLIGPTWREEPIRFGSDVFAIHCRPQDRDPPFATVLFLNMGVDVHSGLGRQTTDLARRLASSGIQSLRIDLRGVGDSPPRPDGALPMYNPAAIDDVRDAIDVFGTSETGPILVTGACSGAYLAFHAVCQLARIDAAVLVNLYCFDWVLKHGDVAFSVARPARTLTDYAGLLKRGTVWRRLLRGRSPVLTIATRNLRRLVKDAVRSLGRVLRGERRETVAQRIGRLRASGKRLALLYSGNDPGLVDLHTHLGPSLRDANHILGTPVRIVEEVDHTFSATAARAALFETIQAQIAISRESNGALTEVPELRSLGTVSPA